MADNWTSKDIINDKSRDFFEIYIRRTISSDHHELNYGLGSWFIDLLPLENIFTMKNWFEKVDTIYKQKLSVIKQFFSLIHFTSDHRWDSKMLVDGEYINDDIGSMLTYIGNSGETTFRSEAELNAAKYRWEEKIQETYQHMNKFYILYKKTLNKNSHTIIKIILNDPDANWSEFILPTGFKHL